MQCNRLLPPAAIDQNIGRLAVSNLDSLRRATISELRHPDNADRQEELLVLGMGLIRARDILRDTMHRAELAKWEASRR